MNIGVLNSGGDSPGLNAVIEGVVGAASRRGWNVVGFYDGFEGLLSEEGDERFEWLTPAACRGLRAKGGTILGTVNKGNFAIKVGVDQKGAIEPAVLEKTKATVRRLGLDALIVVGGDGSQSTALLLSEIGLPVVGVPKPLIMTWAQPMSLLASTAPFPLFPSLWTVWKPLQTRTSA